MKRALTFVVRAFFLVTVAWAFFGGPYCWLSVKAQSLLWGVLLTLLLGRFFCQAVCPLGIVQTFVHALCHPKRHVRRVCTRLPETRAQRIVRWSVFAACVALGAAGCMGVATMVFPISVFGKAVTLWTPGVVVFASVVVLAAVGDGRFWCNWVCPFGTVYNLLAKVAVFRNKVGTGCGNCRRCLEPVANRDAGGQQNKPSGCPTTRREALKGVAVLAVAEKMVDGGLAPVSLPGVPERETEVLPPGAGDRKAFALKCVGCQLCVASCPGRCLVPSAKLASFGQPAMDFRRGYCLMNCVKCGEVCPEGAIGFLQREQRPNVHMGAAVWKRDLCVRTTNGDACTACVRKCPVQAIHLVKGFPVVDRDKCLGCGACEHVCPARPMPAIYVKGHEMQRVVNPVTEADLLAEMKTRLAAGASAVVACGGVIVAEERGRGLDPLLRLLDAGKLSGAVVADRVVGRAAAAIYVRGRAKRVYAELAGRGARELLEANGAVLEAAKTVEAILNHEQTGSCPMERAVAGLEDPKAMVEAIRKAKAK